MNLLDVLEYISDCVMAGMARSGSVYDLTMPPELLERAFKNTVELLKAQVVFSDANAAAVALFADVAKEDLAALCIFLAGYQSKLNDLRGEVLSFGADEQERKSKSWQQVAMHWPIIQGSRNQLALTRIGEQIYDSAAVSRAVSSANA